MNPNLEKLDALYKEIILEHNQEPRNFGKTADADKVVEGYNPLCGDRIQIFLKLSADRKHVQHCSFEGQGCSICMASTSILTEAVEGKTLDQTQALIQDFRTLMQGQDPSPYITGDILALCGVKRFPVRIKCALLGWTTLLGAIEEAAAPVTEAELREWLQPVEDPEMRMSLMDLGLIYRVHITSKEIEVDMTLTSPTCPAAGAILEQVKNRLMEHPQIKQLRHVDVKLVWQPKWDPKTMASEEAKEKLRIW